MKKLLLLGLILLSTSCQNLSFKFKGIVVAKEYTPEGKCHDGRETIQEAGVIVVPHVHKYEPESFVLVVKNNIEEFKHDVLKEEYYKYSVGDSIEFVY